MSKFYVIWTIFCQNLAIFAHFLPHFGLYNYIGKMPAEPHKPFRVSAISLEPLNRFRKSWAFWKEQIQGYKVTKYGENLIFWALPPPLGP